MNFDLVIPTFQRQQKLINCLKSIESAKHNIALQVYIYFSNYEELNNFSHRFRRPWIKFHMVTDYKTTTFWNAHLLRMTADALIYLNDDILLFDDTLDTIENQFKIIFPDFDGVMGLNQTNINSSTKVLTAYGVIGLKYADRFPNRKVWCPDYHRFYGDKELGEFAESINKFKYCEEAKIIHLHPSIDYKQLDMTHIKVREWLKPDRTTYYERKRLGYLCGRDFNQLHKE